MKNIFYSAFLLILFALNIACQSDTEVPPERAITLFEKYMVGTFNNKAQIQEDLKAGQQLHPEARMINVKVDDWILNAPEREGFWMLEEGHFKMPGVQPEVKPYLFFYEAKGETGVTMHVYTFPVEIPTATIRHDRQDLKVEYSSLKASRNFQPMDLKYKDASFQIDTVFNLPGGMTFTFKKKMGEGKLELLELWYKDTNRMTTYDTPIHFDLEK